MPNYAAGMNGIVLDAVSCGRVDKEPKHVGRNGVNEVQLSGICHLTLTLHLCSQSGLNEEGDHALMNCTLCTSRMSPILVPYCNRRESVL